MVDSGAHVAHVSGSACPPPSGNDPATGSSSARIREKGFTLIELMVVMSLLVVLSTLEVF